MMMNRLLGPVAIACALQSTSAIAADAAVCADVGVGTSGPSVSQPALVLGAKAMPEQEIQLIVSARNGSCLAAGITFKGARGKAAIAYENPGICGTSVSSTLSLNRVQEGRAGGLRLDTGVIQPDGSAVYIGRVNLTQPAASSYDFKLVYKQPFNFTVACTAKVDATGVSALWNGQ